MYRIVFDIYTTDDMSKPETARRFFQKAEELGITPEYISLTEPINKPYSLEKAVEFWSQQMPGCYDIKLDKLAGKAGGMLARNRSSGITFMNFWWNSRSKNHVNYILLYISSNKYQKYKSQLLELFKYTVNITNAVYGYITTDVARERQHGTGGIQHRIPGIFWCNYFSNIYIDFFGRKRFFNYEWYRIEHNDKKGAFVYIDNDPLSKITNDTSLEERAKDYLGQESFASRKEYLKLDAWLQKNPKLRAQTDTIQHKKVPDLFKS